MYMLWCYQLKHFSEKLNLQLNMNHRFLSIWFVSFLMTAAWITCMNSTAVKPEEHLPVCWKERVHMISGTIKMYVV